MGEHATYHIEHEAPWTADIEAIAAPVSDWVKTSRSAIEVAKDGAEAVAYAQDASGKIATLALLANTAWESAAGLAYPLPLRKTPKFLMMLFAWLQKSFN